MKKFTLLIVVMLVAAGMALAQDPTPGPGEPLCGGAITTNCITPPSPGTLPSGLSNGALNIGLAQDVLGAHNGYGRGCVMCHAPHGGAQGNGNATGDPNNGSFALWGENLNPYYTKSVTFTSNEGTTYSVTLPSSNSDTSQGSGATTILLCLSCHDGVTTTPAMMRGQTVEALPIVGGTAPTQFGTTQGNSGLSYVNEHPVGPNAIFSCGGYSWDCTNNSSGTGYYVSITTSNKMYTFATVNYPASIWYKYAMTGSSYPLASFTGTVNGVTCTTCHNQHSMTVYKGGNGTYYPTMFFLRGEYMPSTGGNSVAQFCRNCHGGESNELNGLTSVPTT